MKKTTVLIFCCALTFVSGDDANKTKLYDQTPILSSTISSSVTKVPTESVIIKSSTKTGSQSNKEDDIIKQITNTTEPSISTTPDLTTVITKKTQESLIEKSITEKPSTEKPSTEKPSTEKPSTEKPTTEKSTTTDVPITTNAPTPTPVPDPVSKKWQVNGTNETIIVQMAAQIVIHYTDINKKNLSQAINIQPDNRTQATGIFAPYNETLNLSWKSNGQTNNSVKFYFTRDNKTFELKSLEVTLDPAELPNSIFNLTLRFLHSQGHFNTSLGNSYRCIRLQTFNLTRENDTKFTGQIKVSNLQFQAFKTDKKNVFGFAEDCAFETPDVVPIAVGCILAALVVIVLVAYLINRKNRSNGYHSITRYHLVSPSGFHQVTTPRR